MSTNNRKRSATVWHRLLAGTLVGFALVLMVVAGVYTRARSANAAVKNPAIQETRVGAVTESDDSNDPASQADGKGSKTKKIKPPPPPQEPPQPATLATPASPQTPPDPAAAPASPTAPTASTASTPPSPPVAPAAQTKEKSKSKNKDKEKGDKGKVEKGGLIEAPRPAYPQEAREQNVVGNVTVEIVIGEEGNVISAKPTSGPELLRGAAKDAAFKARFRPTLVNGKPAKVAGALSYGFTMTGP